MDMLDQPVMPIERIEFYRQMLAEVKEDKDKYCCYSGGRGPQAIMDIYNAIVRLAWAVEERRDMFYEHSWADHVRKWPAPKPGRRKQSRPTL